MAEGPSQPEGRTGPPAAARPGRTGPLGARSAACETAELRSHLFSSDSFKSPHAAHGYHTGRTGQDGRRARAKQRPCTRRPQHHEDFPGQLRPAGRAQHGRRVEDAAAAVAQAHRLAAVAQAAGAEGARRGRPRVQSERVHFEMCQECPGLMATGARGKVRQAKVWGHHHRDSERSHLGRQGHPEKEETKGTPTLQRGAGQKRPATAEETRAGATATRRGCSHGARWRWRRCGPEGPARGSPRPGTTAGRDACWGMPGAQQGPGRAPHG